MRRPRSAAVPPILSAILLIAAPVLAADFVDDLARIDEALRNKSSDVLPQEVQSCRKQFGYARKLFDMGMETRARRTLQYCFDVLDLPPTVAPVVVDLPDEDELQARAREEYEQALTLTPNLENGLKIYRNCAACHGAEGWGNKSGGVPQIAGQHRKVVIRQLADFRAGNRDSVIMTPYASIETIGGTQAVADVAAYIDTLEISVDNARGPGTALEFGQQIYGDYCAECHGPNGEGSNDAVVPRIQAQHYRYLLRQFNWILDGQRRNANAEMVVQIEGFEAKEIEAVLDYVSRLEPPEELQAPPGWKNPDFN